MTTWIGRIACMFLSFEYTDADLADMLSGKMLGFRVFGF